MPSQRKRVYFDREHVGEKTICTQPIFPQNGTRGTSWSTSIEQNVTELSDVAFEIMLERIADKDAAATPVERILEPKLVVKASVA